MVRSNRRDQKGMLSVWKMSAVGRGVPHRAHHSIHCFAFGAGVFP